MAVDVDGVVVGDEDDQLVMMGVVPWHICWKCVVLSLFCSLSLCCSVAVLLVYPYSLALFYSRTVLTVYP